MASEFKELTVDQLTLGNTEADLSSFSIVESLNSFPTFHASVLGQGRAELDILDLERLDLANGMGTLQSMAFQSRSTPDAKFKISYNGTSYDFSGFVASTSPSISKGNFTIDISAINKSAKLNNMKLGVYKPAARYLSTGLIRLKHNSSGLFQSLVNILTYITDPRNTEDTNKNRLIKKYNPLIEAVMKSNEPYVYQILWALQNSRSIDSTWDDVFSVDDHFNRLYEVLAAIMSSPDIGSYTGVDFINQLCSLFKWNWVCESSGELWFSTVRDLFQNGPQELDIQGGAIKPSSESAGGQVLNLVYIYDTAEAYYLSGDNDSIPKILSWWPENYDMESDVSGSVLQIPTPDWVDSAVIPFPADAFWTKGSIKDAENPQSSKEQSSLDRRVEKLSELYRRWCHVHYAEFMKQFLKTSITMPMNFDVKPGRYYRVVNGKTPLVQGISNQVTHQAAKKNGGPPTTTIDLSPSFAVGFTPEGLI